MKLDFKPTPAQTGHAIGGAIGFGPYRTVAAASDDGELSAAQVTRTQYEHELLLLCCAAAVHAIETAPMSRGTDHEVVGGFYQWIRELDARAGTFLLENLENAVEEYAQASKLDAERSPSPTELLAIEEVFAGRLFALGTENQQRADACFRLCIAAPRVLWPVGFGAATQMLRDAELIREQ